MSNEPKVPRRAERKNLKIVCVNSFFHIIQRQSESFVNCPSSETPNAEMKGGLGRSRRAEGQRGDKIQFIPFLHFLLQKSSGRYGLICNNFFIDLRLSSRPYANYQRTARETKRG